MFGKRSQKAKANALLPSCSYTKVFELLNGLNFEGISPQKVKPGLISFLKRIFKYAHAWAGRDPVAAVAAVTAITVVAAAIAAAVTVAIAVATAVADENRAFFCAVLVECIILTIIAPLAGFSVFPPLVAVLVLSGCYLWNGIRGALGITPKPKALPQTVSELHQYVEAKIRETMQKYRSRALNADSEFAKRLTDAEKNLENTR